MPEKIAPKVLSWASVLEDQAREQAIAASELPFVEGHVALMPDAHWGMGSTVGSVIPTRGAIIPAAVGVDIGCGMAAIETSLDASQLPDNLGPLLERWGQSIPAGVGQGHEFEKRGRAWIRQRVLETGYVPDLLTSERESIRAATQFGTLGAGNHFIELCLDERDRVWIMLHSGSRGAGNQLAQRHIKAAKGLMERYFIELPDPDLAYFVEGTEEFDAYLRDLMWAQAYAMGNRGRMLDLALTELETITRGDIETDRILCHHNYTAKEHHWGKDLWITRKGAILARDGVMGIVPGSMGKGSYIVRGLGSDAAFHSSAHGAGRAMSRREARRRFTEADLARHMEGKTWLAGEAKALVDEIPDSYKDLDTVMEDQADLVEVVHKLDTLVNYKGTT